MAVGYGRYPITSPATSREVVEVLETVTKDGSLRATFELTDPTTSETMEVVFTFVRMRPVDIGLEYTGKLADGGLATIGAYTHPDLDDRPATMALVRHLTP